MSDKFRLSRQGVSVSYWSVFFAKVVVRRFKSRISKPAPPLVRCHGRGGAPPWLEPSWERPFFCCDQKMNPSVSEHRRAKGRTPQDGVQTSSAMKIDNLSPPVNCSEQSGSDVKEAELVKRLLAHVRALRDEVRRLRDELDEPDADLLSVEDAAACLNISERSVRSFLSDGTIPSVKIGRRRLVPRSELDQFIQTRFEGSEEGRS